MLLQPAGIYLFHQTQYLAPAVGNSVMSQLILMYQRIRRWNGRNLEVLSALKVGGGGGEGFSFVILCMLDPEDERTPSIEKSYPRKVSATAQDTYDLSVEIPWAKRSPSLVRRRHSNGVESMGLQEVSGCWLLSHHTADGASGLSLPRGFTAVGKMRNKPQQLCLRMQ